jgi:hypothetical protein
MIPIVVLVAGANALLLYTIADEIRRERSFRRRNRAWMAVWDTSPRGERMPVSQGTTPDAARSSNPGLDRGTVERNTPRDRGDSDLASPGVPDWVPSRRVGCRFPSHRRTPPSPQCSSPGR